MKKGKKVLIIISLILIIAIAIPFSIYAIKAFLPSAPIEPGEPTDPGNPTDPEEPGDPEDPGDPTDPEEPGDPTDPEEPGDPTDPEEPEDPIPAFFQGVVYYYPQKNSEQGLTSPIPIIHSGNATISSTKIHNESAIFIFTEEPHYIEEGIIGTHEYAPISVDYYKEPLFSLDHYVLEWNNQNYWSLAKNVADYVDIVRSSDWKKVSVFITDRFFCDIKLTLHVYKSLGDGAYDSKFQEVILRYLPSIDEF